MTTVTEMTAGISALIGTALSICGFVHLTIALTERKLLWTCGAIGSVEVFGGVWIWCGMLMVLGRYI